MLTRSHSIPNSRTEVLIQTAPVVAVLFGALALGLAIGSEHWLWLAAMLAGTLLLIRPVEIALGLYAFLIPLEFVTAFGQGEGRTTIAFYVGALAGLVLLTIGALRGNLKSPGRTAACLALLVGWSAVTTVWASDTHNALSRLPTAFALGGLYLVASCVRLSERELSWLRGATIAGGCVASGYAAYLFLNGSGFQGRATLASGNKEADPNFFAASLLIPLALACGEFLERRSKSGKLFMASAAALLGTGILLSMSRGAALAAVVMLAVFFYRLRLNWRLLIPVGLLGLGLLAAPDMFFQRIENASETHGAGRLDIWQAGLAIVRDHGLLGAGLDNFPVAYSHYSGKGQIYKGPVRNAHNIYLLVAAEMGVLGIGLLLGAIVSQFRLFQRVRAGLSMPPPRWTALEAGLAAVLVSAFFIDLIWYKSFWWAFILAAATLNARSPDNIEQAQPGHRKQWQSEPVPYTQSTFRPGRINASRV